MSIDAQALFELLPAIHRVRDAELAAEQGLERGPLEELIAVFAEQIAVMDESLEQLHDDLFIETCADWVVPYIGRLIGFETLHGVVPKVASPRALVAHTIALRRRKGTALVLEQLARDVTGWDARAVEYFQRLGTTQYMNHLRPDNLQVPSLRDGEALEWLGTAFDSSNRTADLRRIESGRGRRNIPNVGLHLWRIGAHPRRDLPALRAGERRYRVSPLGHDQPLYNRPHAEDDISHLAEADNVPWPLSRRRLASSLARHYGDDLAEPSLSLAIDGVPVARGAIRICILSDDGAGWAHSPPPDGLVAIDPQLGRISLAADLPDPAELRVRWHEGFPAEIGGGEYERGDSLPTPAGTVLQVPDQQPTISAALAALAGDGVVEITDSGRYEENLVIDVAADATIEIRAANGRRPALVLSGLTVAGGDNATCRLNGLLVAGAPLEVPAAGDNRLARLEIVHCTLVPGIALASDGMPQQPAAASLLLGPATLATDIERSIVGAIRGHERAVVSARDSFIDATARSGVALAAADDASPGPSLSLTACTVIGQIHCSEIGLVSNSILFAAGTAAAGAPVRAARRQVGCVRFSWLPWASVVPARHRCQPAAAADADRIAPQFTSRRYGTPAYGQLGSATADEILRGADDDGEMGGYHLLHAAAREANLRIRLAEYLRVGLAAGIFHES